MIQVQMYGGQRGETGKIVHMKHSFHPYLSVAKNTDGRYVASSMVRSNTSGERFRKYFYAKTPVAVEEAISEYFEAHRDLEPTGVMAKVLNLSPRVSAEGTPIGTIAGEVYFAMMVDITPLLKVGFSKNPRRRIQLLKRTCPGKLHILLTLPGTLNLEAAIHDKLAKYRVNGEWYAYSREIEEMLLDLRSGRKSLGSILYGRRLPRRRHVATSKGKPVSP